MQHTQQELQHLTLTSNSRALDAGRHVAMAVGQTATTATTRQYHILEVTRVTSPVGEPMTGSFGRGQKATLTGPLKGKTLPNLILEIVVHQIT
jgi:hypothetical protein